MPRANPREAGCDAIERIRPLDPREAPVCLSQHGMKQTFAEPQRLAECRALGADAAEIRGMTGIAGDCGAAVSVGPRQQAAPHSAIGAGGAHSRELRRGCVHGGTLRAVDVTAAKRAQTANACAFREAFECPDLAIRSCMANHGMALYAAARVASVRPNTRSSRKRSIDDPERMSSRYQGPSAVSPNSTAPIRRPLAMTSFL